MAGPTGVRTNAWRGETAINAAIIGAVGLLPAWFIKGRFDENDRRWEATTAGGKPSTGDGARVRRGASQGRERQPER